MEKVILLMAVFTTCCSIPQDLSGKMLTFPKETDTDHVKLMTPKTRFQAVTACVRSFTDITRDYAIFSLATRAHINAFGIFKLEATSIRMLVQDAVADFPELSIPLNKRYANNRNFTPGNVLNWRAMEFQKIGKVQEEDNQDQCTA
ncbi:unnamed protein product [Arctogadus glacialis]